MAGKKSHNILNRMHLQHAQDKENDRTNTGTFPVVRKKPIRQIGGSIYSRLMTSLLIMLLCALLGFGYAIQLNNKTSSYETMSEEELTRLISETSTQVQNLQQRKTELTGQLDSLKAAANKQQEAQRIAKENEETSGLLSGRLLQRARASSSPFHKEPRSLSTRRQCSSFLRNYEMPVLKSWLSIT